MTHIEKLPITPENKELSAAITAEGEKRREQLQHSREKVGEKKHDNIEQVTHEAMEKASGVERVKEHEQTPAPAERRHNALPSKLQREVSFSATMKEVQQQLSAPSRAFSKLIHNKTIEKISDVTGNTVARPNAILAGSVAAFVLTLSVYLLAKNLGYPLSGFETIGAFILGWVIGLTYDFLRVMITGRSS